MRDVELLVIGGGPAGMSASITAAKKGCDVLLVDRFESLGGQLVKQTHMFFGSEKQYASYRGIDIKNILLKEIKSNESIKVLNDTTVLGIYDDGVVTLESKGKYRKIKPKSIVVATGASEKPLGFINNDLPGIYGAGAVQTLMNVYGVKPGDDVLMVGAGNIGLIVSYQLLQANVNVKAIIDAAPYIGGYSVHASKVRRMGVDIYTKCSVKKAYGKDFLEGVVLTEVDKNFNPIKGTEKKMDIDVLCIAVGLSPLTELLWQAGLKMKYIKELGGFVPLRDESMQTTVKGIFIAGDVAGVEEASSAMVEGHLAGLNASKYLGYEIKEFDKLNKDYLNQLNLLRKGPVGEKITKGIKKSII
ncbi:MAG: FAD-dependent oxidoreductase [Firmicutes bacterium]|nr:FAD-dependent oxidoreductase [Bacillota bacterium]